MQGDNGGAGGGRPPPQPCAAAASGGSTAAAEDASAAAAAALLVAQARLQLMHDRLVALIVPLVWLPHAWRIAPRLSLADNLQWMSPLLSLPLAYLLWPALSRRTYQCWRPHVVAALRFWAFAMPFTHDPAWFNVTAPDAATAPLLAMCMGASRCMRARAHRGVTAPRRRMCAPPGAAPAHAFMHAPRKPPEATPTPSPVPQAHTSFCSAA